MLSYTLRRRIKNVSFSFLFSSAFLLSFLPRFVYGNLFDHAGNYEMRSRDFRGIKLLNVARSVFIRRPSFKSVTQFAVLINVIRRY